MPSGYNYNPLMGPPAPGGMPSLVGAGPRDSANIGDHPVLGGARATADDMMLSRKAGALVAAAIALVVLVHVGGFRSTVTIGG